MAKHGCEKSLKRINASSRLILPKKDKVWIVKPRAGPHKRSESIALLSFLRDILKVTDNAREARKIINGGKIFVDGRVVKDYKFPVSFMDVVYIPDLGAKYYVDLDYKGRFIAKMDNRDYKYLKIIGKRIVNGGRQQITLSDGRTLLTNEKYKVGDTLKFSIPEFKVLGHYPLEPGAKCIITNGTHAGTHGIIKSISEGTSKSPSKVVVETQDGSSFATLKDYVYVLG